LELKVLLHISRKIDNIGDRGKQMSLLELVDLEASRTIEIVAWQGCMRRWTAAAMGWLTGENVSVDAADRSATW
jgi:hypothetical protein